MNDGTVAQGDGLTAHIARACAAEIGAITSHRWLTGAASGTLLPAQISTWAAQDLAWGGWYMPVMAAAAAGPPETKAAFDWLDGSMDAEIAWFREMAAAADRFPGGDRIWPSFLGYAAWARQISADSPFRAQVITWACEGSYHWGWSAVRDTGPRESRPPWVQWAIGNWAGDGFAGMMGDMTAGLDIAHAAQDDITEPARRDDATEIARQVFLWEAECWGAVYDGRGWSA